jgi:hypothetical protein
MNAIALYWHRSKNMTSLPGRFCRVFGFLRDSNILFKEVRKVWAER